MKGRLLALASVMFILSSSMAMSFTSVADIAPVRYVEGGNLAVFVDSPEIIMDSYSVVVEVSLPWVNESLSYCLRNPTFYDVNLTVMVPLFQYSSNGASNLEPVEGEIQLVVNGAARNILPEELVMAEYSDITFQGVYAPITLPANSYTNISVTCGKMAIEWTGQPVEEFGYFYSAETAAFWNGTVRHGAFNLSYHGNWENTNFTAPNPVNNGREVHSEVWDIDVRMVDANYTVHIITGDVTPPYDHPDLFEWILPLAAIIALVVAIGAYGLYLRRRKSVK